jgi:hypothetical protein
MKVIEGRASISRCFCLASLAKSALGVAVLAAAISSLPARAFVYYGDSKYTLVDGPTWEDAEANAVSIGGHLVAIGSEDENTFLFSAFNITGDWENPGYHPLWAGFSDAAQEGTWVWSNGESVTYMNWAPILPQYGQGCAAPDGGTPCQPSDEDYLHLGRFPGGYWNDTANDNSRTIQGIAEIPYDNTAAVPGPLPTVGIAAAFGYSRKLRAQIKSFKIRQVETSVYPPETPSMRP